MCHSEPLRVAEVVVGPFSAADHLVIAGLGAAPHWPLRANVFALGVANGAFSIAAIGSMMALAGCGREAREVFFFNDTAATEIYTRIHSLSLHGALPISRGPWRSARRSARR